MVGYLNNGNETLDEWYQLFIQKHHTLLSQNNKSWKNAQNLKLSHLDKNHWKYIPIKELLKHNFSCAENVILNISQYEKLILPIDSYRLVFINGQLSIKLSDSFINPWSIKINKNSNQYSIFNPTQPNIFSYLTGCLGNTTTHVVLPKGKITKKPLYILYISEGLSINNTLITSHYRHHIEIEQNTNTSIIEHFININEHKHFSGIYTSIKIGDHAKLHHTRLIFGNRSSYHTANHDINIGHNSHINSNVFVILGPKFTYHQTNAQLNYSKSSVSLNSLTILKDTDVGNICTYVEHNNQAHAASRQLHKIIACNHSVGTFNGLIKVNPNSIKADGKMTNNNLLLHKNAIINSTPKLEIYSDDVQCSHGTTIGQINIDHLFYLITRGISSKDALKILIHAFATEIINTIQNTLLKNIILTKIEKTLARSLYENVSYKKN